jgi:hypothetical protein
VVDVVAVHPVVLEHRGVLGQARVGGKQAVADCTGHVGEELAVVRVDRVARGSGVADGVVVRTASGDLDRESFAVEVGGRAGVEPGVTVAVGLTAGVQPVVDGEGEGALA